MLRVALVANVALATLTVNFSAGAADPAAILRATTSLPVSSVYTRGFLAFVHDFNELGKNKIRIEIINDHNASFAPPGLEAVRDGRLDMAFGPILDHAQLVPEANAISASEIKIKELRANGGMALIDQIYRVRADVRFMGILSSGARLHIYLRDAPRLNGNFPNLSNTRIAGDPIYREFLSSLGAEPVSAGFPTALEILLEGKADGIIWPRVGLQPIVYAKRLKYRIDPGFSQIITGVVMNLRRWSRLRREDRELLEKTIIDHERASYIALRVETGKQDEALDNAGLRVISIKGRDGKNYTARTTKYAWSALRKKQLGYAAQLEKLFYRERTQQ